MIDIAQIDNLVELHENLHKFARHYEHRGIETAYNLIFLEIQKLKDTPQNSQEVFELKLQTMQEILEVIGLFKR